MGERKTSIHTSPSIIALAVFSLFFFSFDLAAQEDNFRWQDAAAEVDSLAFSQSFIDSVKNKHIGVKPSRSSRNLKEKALWGEETLVYEIQWGPIKAGYMILTAEPDLISGQIRLGAKLLSNNFVSSIYKIRDYMITWIDAKEFYPLFAEQHTREKKYTKDEYIIHDNKRGKIIIGGKNDIKLIESPPFTHNFISALYYARSMELSRGDSFSVNMYASSEVNPIKLRVLKNESVSVGAGKFNCVVVEPKLAGDGPRFNKNDKMTVWISQDDEHRVPVMAKSKIKVGSITAKLVQVIRTSAS
jgi:hypothetical protein